MRPRDTLVVAAMCGLLAATIHVAQFHVRVDLLGRLAGASRDLAVLAPIAYLGCFAPAALGLLLLRALAPRLASPQVQGTVFASLAAFGMLLHVGTVHPLALVLLSLGVGMQFGRWLARDVPRGTRVAGRLSVLLLAVLTAAEIPALYYRWSERAALSSLPAPRADAPNVILLILDTVRAANLSAYGYERPTTPVLTDLASRGVRFETAIATAPWTAPTHASLLTGRYPYFTGIDYLHPLADSIPSVVTAFRSSGYATGAFMGNAYFAGRVTGLDRDFGRYDDYPLSLPQVMWSATFTQVDAVQRMVDLARSGMWSRLPVALARSRFRIVGENRGDRFSAAELVDRFLAWRDGVGNRPFFAMLNFFDAHAPYVTPMADRFNGGARSVDRYDGAIAYTDSILGHLVLQLKERGVLDNTVLVVTADHGEQFGEHGLFTHGNSLFLELLHVPLVVHAPGRVPAGGVVQRVVSLRDIPATLLDLAGLGPAGFPGHSIAPLWRDSASTGDVSAALAEAEQPHNQVNRWPTSFGPMKALVTDAFHYIRRGDGLESVYSWKGDTTGRGALRERDEEQRAIEASRQRLRAELGPAWTARGPS